MSELKYIAYVRKSSKGEEKQILSIEAQIDEIQQMEAQADLTIVRTIHDKCTAKVAGRPGFNEMMRRIEAGEANAIVAWKLDRLARNFDDGGKIITFLQLGKIKEIRTYGRTYLPTDNVLLIALDLGMANQYVRDLSENTKRGFRKKIQLGEFPHIAPFGYRNNPATKRIKIDRKRAPIVREVFERYSTGSETLHSIREFLASRGVRSKTGKLVCNGLVSRMLTNPIYYGHFQSGGEVHAGIHEPILTKSLFDRVQEILAGRWRATRLTPKGSVKPYLGVLVCGECGRTVTGEVQKGHTYYRCTKRKTVCDQRYVREEALDLQFRDIVRPYSMSAVVATELLRLLYEEEQHAAKDVTKFIKERQAELAQLQSRLQHLKACFFDEVIDREDFVKEKANIMSRQKTTEERISLIQRQGARAWIEPYRNWISTAQQVDELSRSGSKSELKSLAMKIFGSNLYLEGQKVRGRATKPWSILAVNEYITDIVSLHAVARTHFMDEAALKADKPIDQATAA